MYNSKSFINNLLTEKDTPKIIGTKTTPNFKVTDYKDPDTDDIQKDEHGRPMFRSVKTKGGDLVKIAIMKKAGPEGGHSKVTSIWKKKDK